MKRHMKACGKEEYKPFKCNNCQKRFPRKDACKRHKLSGTCKNTEDTKTNITNNNTTNNITNNNNNTVNITNNTIIINLTPFTKMMYEEITFYDRIYVLKDNDNIPGSRANWAIFVI